MATAATEKPVNGNYGSHPSYNHAEAFQPGQAGDVHPDAHQGEQGSATSTQPLSSTVIGWYFVEQYYNTMSKEPHKLYLYYTKKSQFVAGNEAEKVNVAVGQRKIIEMIRDMDIQDCKVRVTNVDSQESGKCILVQVIGEMSNRAAPHRKFVQTFVLAEQPTGYYVLNDIFRYIVDEEEEGEVAGDVLGGEQGPSPEVEPTPATLTSSENPAERQHDVEQVDRKLRHTVLEAPEEQMPSVLKATNGVAPEDDPAGKQPEESPVADKEGTLPAPEQAAESAAAEEITQPEKPSDPDPTPIASPPQPAKATPAEPPTAPAPAKPPVSKTWANLVASNKKATPTPSSSAPNPVTPVTPAALKQKSANAPSKDNATQPTSAGEEANLKPLQNGGSGWQMAGTDKQRQGRQHSQSVSSNQDNTLAYVKNVTDKVDASILKATLSDFGELAYFDVNRQKNCAFVEFEQSAAYNACIAANPHNIGGEQVFVEERRPRANAYGGNFNGRGGMRGGRSGQSDRPGSQGRGGFNKDAGRGGFAPRGRGGAVTPRGGRGGQAQVA